MYQGTDMIFKSYKVYGDTAISDAFFMMTKKELDEFDTMLVHTKHPLAYEAGTQEYRFRSYMKEMVEKNLEKHLKNIKVFPESVD